MGLQHESTSPAERATADGAPSRGWGLGTRLVFRFLFAYWFLYSLPVILLFPGQLLMLVASQTGLAGTPGTPPAPWLAEATRYLGYPSQWLQEGMNRFTPWVSHTLLGVDVEVPTNFTGSGDRLFNYCTAFADLVLALEAAFLWTLCSELWRCLRTHRRPSYDRLHVLLRAVVRFHLMYQMIIYGAMKVWCAQFPPITDYQLDVKYGDSSPMGLLWRFMQFSQPYTSITGIVEFTCGVLLICRRTELLGAMLAFGATLQVFLLNMCYDVPVKLMSGHLVLMALLLIVADAPRLVRFFLLGRPAEPRPLTPLFGGWTWLNRSAVVLRTAAFAGFAGLYLLQAYQNAKTQGILAPENPTVGRWVGKEFVRDGKRIAFPEQPENAPPRPFTQSKWQGGPEMPAVVRVSVAPMFLNFVFADGSGVSFRNTKAGAEEMTLVWPQTGRPAGQLRVAFPEPDVMTLEGPVEGQEVRLTLRRVPAEKKDYLLKTRGFHWVQDRPFNR